MCIYIYTACTGGFQVLIYIYMYTLYYFILEYTNYIWYIHRVYIYIYYKVIFIWYLYIYIYMYILICIYSYV